MLIVNIFEAKAKLSEFLDAVAHGERVLICKRNRPIAELRAVESARIAPRPIGLARGQVDVPDSFFATLPDDVMNGFYPMDEATGRVRAAEKPPTDDFAGHEPIKPRRKSGRAR